MVPDRPPAALPSARVQDLAATRPIPAGSDFYLVERELTDETSTMSLKNTRLIRALATFAPARVDKGMPRAHRTGLRAAAAQLLKRGWALGCMLALLALQEGVARADCNGGPAVDVSLELVPRDSQLRDALERRLTAELGTRAIDLCRVLPGNPPVLAHVRVQAPAPELSPALIQIRNAGAAVERRLEIATLPQEARPSAIASAVDELLQALLADAREGAAQPLAAAPEEPARGGAARAEQPPLLELGLAGSASSFLGQRDALGADVLARVWPASSVALSARAGTCTRWSRPLERGEVQPRGDLHVGISAGYRLLPLPSKLQLLAQAALGVARVGFDEQPSERFAAPEMPSTPVTPLRTATADPLPSQRYELDRAWSLVSSLGVEASYRLGSLGLSAALVGLVPLLRAESDWGDTTSLSHVGAELSFGIWLAFGQASAAGSSAASTTTQKTLTQEAKR